MYVYIYKYKYIYIYKYKYFLLWTCTEKATEMAVKYMHICKIKKNVFLIILENNRTLLQERLYNIYIYIYIYINLRAI